MADNTANIKVNVTSQGSKELRADAEATAAAYKRAEDSLKKISTASKRTATPVAAAKMAADKEELTSYGVSRSAVGTGAAGRDFAQQAQASSGGLGGLVRLYATFAANIFAATAAFSALSKAADTTNMIRGLDQLGASSGRNLGTLAKNLTSVSDGAISLRDSMEAVAKTSSAGLTNQQIMRLGAVAKNASQALGVGMPDAISRLSRGISKIEPELLDELGIFVRVDKAVTDYARSLGKASSSLSDFERRQAYAQAVLKEGEEKFSSINLEANPYAKLLASLANTAQQVLEIINKGLGPIANLLAENSGVLVTALTILVGTLLNKALPAIGQWREGLQKAAADSRKAALDIVEGYGARFVERTEASFKVPLLKRQLEEAEKTAKIAAGKTASVYAKALEDGVLSTKTVAFKEISETGTLSERGINLIKRQAATIKDTDNEAKLATRARLNEMIAVHNIEKQLVREKEDMAKKLNTARERALETASKAEMRYMGEWQRMENARLAASKAERLSIVANVSTAAKEGGIGEGFKVLKEGITDNKVLGGFDKFRTVARGTFTIIASAITTAATAFQVFYMWVGLALVAFQILNKIFSNTAKEAEATAKALEDLDSSTENLKKTIDQINKKSFLEQLSTSSMSAKFTALEGLSNAIVTAFEKAQQEIEAMTWWDKGIDLFSRLWGGDVSSKLAASIGGAMAQSFKALKGSPAERQIKEEIKALLKVDAEDKKSLTEAYKLAPEPIKEQVIESYKKLGENAAKTDGALKELQESQKALNKASQDFMNLFVPKDPQSLMGMGIMKVVSDLNVLLSNPLTEVTGIVEGFKNLNIFPAETAENFIKLSQSVNQNAEDFGRAQARIEEYSVEIAKLDKQIAEASKNKKPIGVAGVSGVAFETGASIQASRGKMGAESIKNLEAQKEILENARTEAEKYGSNLNKELQKAKLELGQGLTLAFNKGLDLVTAKFAAEAAKGASIYTNAIAGVMGDTKAAAMLRLASDKATIAAQQRAIDVQLDLIKQTQNLAIKTELSTAALDKSNYLKQKENSFVESDREALQAKIDNIDKNIVPQLQRKEVYMQTAFQPGGVEKLKRGYNQQEGQFSEQKAINDAITVGIQVQGAVIQKNNLAAQDFAKTLEYQMSVRRISVKNEQESLDIIIKQKKNQEEILSTLLGIGGFAGAEVQRQAGILKIQQQELTAQQQRLSLGFEIEKQEKALTLLESGKSLLKGQQLTDAIKETKISLQTAVLKQNEFDIITASQLAQTKLRSEIEYTALIQAENNRLKQEEYQINIDILSKTSELLSAEQSLSQTKKDALYYSDLAYISIKNSTDVKSAELKATQALLQADQKRASELDAIRVNADKARAIINDTSIDPDNVTPAQAGAIAVLSEINKKTKTVEETYERTKTQAQDLKKIELERLEIAKEAELRAQNWKDLMEDIAKTTVSLGVVFGEVGAKIGAAAEIFAKMAQEREANLSREEGMRKRMSEIEGDDSAEKAVQNAKEYSDLQIALGKQTQKNQRDTVRGYAAEAGAIKSLFKEKTAAHKLFAALEMSLHVTSMAMLIAENAATLAALPAKIANGVASFFKENPWAGFAGAAAFLALMSSLGAGSGGSATAPTYTTKEQRQETQGTGQVYVEGKLEETGRGVFGDPEARSESIANSLEIIKDSMVDGQDIYNKMAESLLHIERSMEAAVESLFQISGLRTGSLFGTKETTSSSGIQGLFGKTVSTAINDSGIKLSGTILELAAGADGAAKVWEEIIVTTKKSGFLGIGASTSTSLQYQEDELGARSAKALDAIKEIFTNAQGTFEELGSELGISQDSIIAQLNTISIDSIASLRDLKGSEFTEAFNALINSTLDDVAQNLFSGLTEFRDFGEGFLETAIRLTNNNKVINRALQNLGIDITSGLQESMTTITRSITRTVTESVQTGVTAAIFDQNQNVLIPGGQPIIEERSKEVTEQVTKPVVNTVQQQSIAITDALQDAAGGLGEYLDLITSFTENFLTKSEQQGIQIGIKNRALTDLQAKYLGEYPEIAARLNSSALNSREAFGALVLDITKLAEDPKMATLSVELLQLSGSFTELYASAEKLNSLKVSELKLTGRATEARDLERNNITEGMAIDEAAMQRYNWSLEDLAALRKLETELLSAEGKTYEALIRTREDELSQLTEDQRAIKQKIYDAQDAAKTETLNIKLMQLTGRTMEALNLTRENELDALSETDKTIQQLIWDAETLTERIQLETDLLTAQGKTYDALIASRNAELKTMTTQQSYYKKLIWAATDFAKAQNQQIKLLNAQGKSAEATALQRSIELKGMSAVEAQTANLIWAYEDLNTAEEALKASVQSTTDTIKSSIDVIGNSIKQLKDYRDSLLISELSPLTTAGKYIETKSQIEELMTIIDKPAVTDADKQAQADAVSKLTSLSDTYLQFSRTLFASSSEYTKDFEYILGNIDKATGALGNQLSDAEKQLIEIKQSNTYLEAIETSTKTTAELLQDYLDAKATVTTLESTPGAVGNPNNPSLNDWLDSISDNPILNRLAEQYMDPKWGVATKGELDQLDPTIAINEIVTYMKGIIAPNLWSILDSYLQEGAVGSVTPTIGYGGGYLSENNMSGTSSATDSALESASDNYISSSIRAASDYLETPVETSVDTSFDITLIRETLLNTDSNIYAMLEEIKALKQQVIVLEETITNNSIMISTTNRQGSEQIVSTLESINIDNTIKSDLERRIA